VIDEETSPEDGLSETVLTPRSSIDDEWVMAIGQRSKPAVKTKGVVLETRRAIALP